MSIASQVIDIIAEQAMLDPAEITLESSLAELGVDSMGVVECIFAIEETFDISVPFNANEPSQSDFDISTVGSITKAIEKLVNEAA
ncbi:acyl carrier protein [Nereida ignava]|uniref:Acyl carrier protein n=1 Tax=Nereida ignava TaxID=282199 RepID=A0A0U1NIG7_9RHOB|nr:acyl carrier protein [Nereida ignava]CRK74329.1 Acyl carrier protein [Nereida ignava]SFJ46009.1 acyl carrier protein [Nereida ignava DSM 16309]